MIRIDLIQMENINFNKSYIVEDKNKIKYQAIPVPGDGNCLFSSISYFLFDGNKTDSQQLRLECANYIDTHRQYFCSFIDNFEQYLINLCQPNTWGGEVEILCLSKIYGLKVHIFIVEPNLCKLSNEITIGSENNICIQLMYYNGLHYWPLIPLSPSQLRKQFAGADKLSDSNQWNLMKKESKEILTTEMSNNDKSIKPKSKLLEIQPKCKQRMSKRLQKKKKQLQISQERKQKNCVNESKKQKNGSLLKICESNRKTETNEPIKKRNTSLKKERRKKENYINESFEKKIQRVEKMKKYMQQVYRNESQEKRKKREENMYICKKNIETHKMLRKKLTQMQNMTETSKKVKKTRAKKQTSGCFVARCEYIEKFVNEHYLCEMDGNCQFCRSKYFHCEINTENFFSKCCHKGKNVLEFDFTVPNLIKSLLTTNHHTKESKNFRENIRQYNSALAFASFGAKNIKQIKGKGPYCFKVQGIIHHETSNLKTNNGNRKYAQLYIIDSDLATKEREENSANINCDKNLMLQLDQLVRSINCYAKTFKMLRELENEEKEKCQRLGTKTVHYSIWLLKKKIENKGRYNLPVFHEIAAVFDDKEGCPPYLRDIEIHNRDGRHIKLSIISQHTDPMTYPLLYPFGGNGWHDGMKSISGHKVTQLQYYAYLLSVRDEFSIFLHSGKLTQQFIVDAYCKMEANRLNYIRTHQSDLRVEYYQGLYDYLNRKTDNRDDYMIGKSIILPSTFIGSPRHMAQNYQDAMTLVSRFGKPDLFITFTCNPKWREIQENIESYETPSDRPDIVSRVFHEKLKAFQKDIKENHIFGEIKALIDVIEFQKRGLPHCHMLIILEDKNKIRNPTDIDNIVSAEIPDPKTEPRLFQIVSSCMIHGPCGKLNKNSPCMDGNICTKNYPKQFNDTTQFNVDGYPHYRRKNNGNRIEIKNKDGTTRFKIDNRFIVPYNKYVLAKYNAHVNVEVCSTIKSVKYLFKYVYKGHDCATITVNSNDENIIEYDEINSFINTRYVSAPEACYRLFEYKMHDCTHAIIRLALHLENMQPVCFRTGKEESALHVANLKNTTLSGWFELNKTNLDARQYFYHEIPEHYVFTKKTGVWTKRKKFFYIIGRLYNVNIAEGERYFLRLMLLHQKGCTSYESLRTVNGIILPTFKEAAIAMKLLADDNEWDRALSEAEMYQLPKCLRQLFATICIFCNPSEPLKLWKKHVYHLSEDFIKKYNYLNDNNETAEMYALAELNLHLIQHGKKCSDFQLTDTCLVMSIENKYNLQAEEMHATNMIELLNDDQKFIYNFVMAAIYGNFTEMRKEIESNLFFIDAPGGTGKTFLYNTLMHTIRAKGDTIIPVAWTGIAASLLRGGRTVHSAFKLPVPLNETSSSSLKLNSKAAQLIKKSKLIVWDEVTMSPYYALDAVDKFLQELMNNSSPFGGKVLLLGGDFMQCLPVVKHGNRVTVVSTTIKNSKHWHLVKKFTSYQNMRVNKDATDYAEWILKIGKGLSLDDGISLNELIQLPEECISKKNLIDDIYGESLRSATIDIYENRAILAPKNSDTLKINDDVLKQLAGEPQTYFSIDSILNDENNTFKETSIEFLNSLTPSGMPPHKLNLKIGAIIMLLRNLNGKLGLCNGTRLSVIDLQPNIIKARILTGEKRGQMAILPRIILQPSNDELPFQMRRVQFPIRLSFSMTINKAQGQSFEKVGLFLPQPVFSHGQLYVALSRARSFNDLKIKLNSIGDQEEVLGIGKKHWTINRVYREIFDADDQ